MVGEPRSRLPHRICQSNVIGVGDQLTLDPGGGNQEIFYILAVDGPGLVTIHGTALAGHPGESYEIRRAYTGPTGLQAWENARDGDLVLENRAEVGVAYNDGAAFTGAVAIDTLSSSATNYMYLAVAKAHGHNGLAGTGVLLDGLGGTNGRPRVE